MITVTAPFSEKIIRSEMDRFRKTLEPGEPVKLIIPDGVKEIGNISFYHFTDLKELVVPGSVKRISSSAFNECWNLEKVTLSYGIEAIDDEAFGNCFNLKTLKVPSSIRCISPHAFNNNMETLYLPLRSTAFYDGSHVDLFTPLRVSYYEP